MPVIYPTSGAPHLVGTNLPKSYRNPLELERQVCFALAVASRAVIAVYRPLAIACGGLGFVVGLYFALSYAPESVDYRLTRYGYPRRSATQGRRERNAVRDRERQAKYDAVWRQSEG